MKKIIYLPIYIMLLGSIPIKAQSLNLSNSNNGQVSLWTQNWPDDSAHFYLLDNGHYSHQNSFTHNYAAKASPGYNPKAYALIPYDNQLPSYANLTGSVPPNFLPAQTYSMPTNPTIAQSWAVNPQKYAYLILTFSGLSHSANGCVSFYYNSNELAIETNEAQILDSYNGWVTNRQEYNVSMQDFNKEIRWNFSNLATNQQRLVYIPVRSLRRPVAEALVGSSIRSTADCGSHNNINRQSFHVMGSPHDPNNLQTDVNCLTFEKPIDPNKTYEINYKVNFLNVGTGPAQDVHVYVDLDEEYLDFSTLQFTKYEYSNFTYEWLPSGGSGSALGELHIVFPYIGLPGLAQANPMVSYDEAHSYISFKLCTKPLNFVQNFDDVLINAEAAIVFDQEQPIITNEVDAIAQCDPLGRRLAAQPCSIIPPSSGLRSSSNDKIDFFVQPNPADNTIYLTVSNPIKNTAIEVLNSVGQSVLKFRLDEIVVGTNIDISTLNSGTYLIQLSNDQIRKVTKLVKL